MWVTKDYQPCEQHAAKIHSGWREVRHTPLRQSKSVVHFITSYRGSRNIVKVDIIEGTAKSSSVIVSLVGVRVDGSSMPGGTSGEKPANPEVQGIIDSIKPELEKQLEHTLPQLTLLSYKTQVVAGINYFAKMNAGCDSSSSASPPFNIHGRRPYIVHFRWTAGKTYVRWASVDIGEEDVVMHLRVYQDLGNNLSLTSYKYPKGAPEPINYF
ncbi:Cystatin-A [Chionoecetes opilio]|uniref:Cystatin-A n=1 Tax=Chionoecetes opilio TaxID=41210 RepID=A0A8J4YBT0_CHIOP|nr:Cystatin-A [Chionoecetes opilio]